MRTINYYIKCCGLSFILLFLITLDVAAQEVTIGGKLPDIKLKDILWHTTTGGNLLKEFSGKPLIIDFWATTCTGCVASMPKVDSILKENKDKLNILLTTFESKSKVMSFWTKKSRLKDLRLPSLTSDTVLRKVFPHHGDPHIVWIGADGIVKAITSGDLLNRENVRKFLNNKDFKLPLRKENMDEEIFRVKLPVSYIDQEFNDGRSALQYSYLGGHVPGIQSRWNLGEQFRDKEHSYRFGVTNKSLRDIVEMCFGLRNIRDNQFVFRNVTDSLIFLSHYEPRKYDNIFSYDLLTRDTSKANAFRCLLTEIEKYLEVKISRSDAKIKYYAVTRLGEEDNLASKLAKDKFVKFGVQHVSRITWGNLNQNFFNSGRGILSSFPIVDETGIDPAKIVDIQYPLDWRNITKVNVMLANYGLKVEVKEKEMDVIVVSK